MDTDHFRRIDTTVSKKIRSIKVIQEIDCDPDFSHIGVYTDDLDPWNIDRRTGKYIAELDDEDLPNRSGREYRFFKPYAGGEPAGSEAYKKYGLQDFKLAEDYNRQQWWYVGIYAQAEIVVKGVIQKIISGGLWGIEDSDKETIKETTDDQLEELKDILKELGFTEGEIVEVEVKYAK